MQCSIKIHKGSQLHWYFCSDRTNLLDLFAFWFLKKLILNSALHLVCRVCSRGSTELAVHVAVWLTGWQITCTNI